MTMAALALLIGSYPKRLPRWPAWLEVALLPLLLAWIVADAAWLLPSPNWGSRSLQPLLMALVLINLLRQGLAARGQPRVLRAVVRVTFWGAFAMAATAATGTLFGTTVA